MSKRPLPNRDLLLELLTFNKSSGDLVWKPRSIKHFPTPNHMNTWNTRYSLLNAGYTSKRDGYVYLDIEKVSYVAHRLIWLMVYNEEPDEIDHINGIRYDNRLSNLRNVTHRVNCTNSTKPSNNTSGHVGVYRNNKTSLWCAQIKIKGKVFHLGSFLGFNEAVQARKNAETIHNFHKNHGKN